MFGGSSESYHKLQLKQ